MSTRRDIIPGNYLHTRFMVIFFCQSTGTVNLAFLHSGTGTIVP